MSYDERALEIDPDEFSDLWQSLDILAIKTRCNHATILKALAMLAGVWIGRGEDFEGDLQGLHNEIETYARNLRRNAFGVIMKQVVEGIDPLTLQPDPEDEEEEERPH